jgi:hypothetical protein
VFAGLVLGAFWLGTAQGFGLFYRHETGAPGAASATALIFGAGAVAALGAPTIMLAAEAAGAPFSFTGTMLAAAGTQIAALAVATSLPHRDPVEQGCVLPAPSRRDVLMATTVGAAAWFGMGRLMADIPVALQGCGVSANGVTGAVSWHVLSMYTPALLLAPFVRADRGGVLAGIGLVALGSAAMVPSLWGASPGTYEAALILAGSGWCVATLGATLQLSGKAFPRSLLALHDGVLLLATLAGVLS